EVKLWDLLDLQKLRTPTVSPASSLAFSPDGRQVGAVTWKSEDRTARTWDVLSGQPVRTVHLAKRHFARMRFRADGQLFLLSGSDEGVTLHDPVTGQEQLPVRGHQGFVYNVTASPDGRWLAILSGRYGDATGPDLREFRVWNTITGKEQSVFRSQ